MSESQHFYLQYPRILQQLLPYTALFHMLIHYLTLILIVFVYGSPVKVIT